MSHTSPLSTVAIAGTAALVGAAAGVALAQLMRSSSESPPSRASGLPSTDTNKGKSAHDKVKEVIGEDVVIARDNKRDILKKPTVSSTSQSSVEVSEEIVREQFARNISFMGQHGFQRFRNSFVIVVGVGGVGSHCANMLVRSGVERVRLIDFDQVTLSSLNRNSLCTLADVGITKVTALKRRLLEVVPWAQIDDVNALFSQEDAEQLLAGNPTFVVDAIDNLETKCELIHYCYERGIPLISSMGAGMKADPSYVRIGDIAEASNDALLRKVKGMLRKRFGITRGVTAVYSQEAQRAELLPLEAEQQAEADEYRAIKDINMRVRIVPVLGTMPAIMGNACAAAVMLELSGQVLLSAPPLTGRIGVYRQVHRELKQREEAYDNSANVDVIDNKMLEFLIEYMWRSCSCISGLREAPALVRWDISQPFAITNAVLMKKCEGNAHCKRGSLSEYDEGTRVRIERRLKQAPQLYEIYKRMKAKSPA